MGKMKKGCEEGIRRRDRRGRERKKKKMLKSLKAKSGRGGGGMSSNGVRREGEGETECVWWRRHYTG